MVDQGVLAYAYQKMGDGGMLPGTYGKILRFARLKTWPHLSDFGSAGDGRVFGNVRKGFNAHFPLGMAWK